MIASEWIVAVVVVLPVVIALAVGLTLVYGRFRRMRTLVRRGARRLSGRLDPASEASGAPALLAELDGLLLRASGWPVEGDAPAEGVPPYLEVCTPVEGVLSPLVVVRRSESARLLPLLGDDTRGLPTCELSTCGLSIFGNHHAMWAAAIFGRHPSWMLLEIDTRMLRVITNDPQSDRFDAVAVEQAVRGFAAAVPAILVAAGVTRSSAHGSQQ